jgi:hypothetical protein
MTEAPVLEAGSARTGAAMGVLLLGQALALATDWPQYRPQPGLNFRQLQSLRDPLGYSLPLCFIQVHNSFAYYGQSSCLNTTVFCVPRW